MAVWCVPAVADRSNPNYGQLKSLVYDGGAQTWACKGYVQCQPSYHEVSRGHAQAGRMYFESRIGTTVVNTYGPVNTAAGSYEGDSRILSKTYTYTSPVGTTSVSFSYSFIWRPHTGDPTTPWPYPFSFGGETE